METYTPPGSRLRSAGWSRRRFLREGARLAALSVGLLAATGGGAALAAPLPDLATGASLGLPQPRPGGAAVAGKPMYQVDPQHTGRSPHAGPRQLMLLRVFDSGAFPTEDPLTPRPDIQSSSAIGPDGTIYIANFPGNLFALRDPGSGDALEVLWRFHPLHASSLHATPVLGRDGTVYLGFTLGAGTPDVHGVLYALRAPTSGIDPQVVWSVDLGPGNQTTSPTVADDGTIFAVSGMGRLSAVAPDGTVRWTAQTGPTLRTAPALGTDGTVYLASMDGNLYAVAPPTAGGQEGTVRWTFDFGAHLGPTPLVTAEGRGGQNGIGSGASPTLGPDGTIYIGANNSNFYAITPAGQLKWLFEAERELAGIWATAALSADNSTLYFGANKGGIYALSAADGALRWRFNIYGSVYSSPALDSQGILYTGSTVGHVYALDTSTGQPIADYDNGAQVWSAPSVCPNGTLVVADREGRIMVLGTG